MPDRRSNTEGRNAKTQNLDLWTSREVVEALIAEDLIGVRAAQRQAEKLAHVVDQVFDQTSKGGIVHYFGAGASGRLGVLDATEATPTFGVEAGFFTAHFPGGIDAIVDSNLDLEDSEQQGIVDASNVVGGDVVVGISASGATPYVKGALRQSRRAGALTVLFSCNEKAPLKEQVDLSVIAETGEEALTGSTRLKAGTATKVLLNAFSTSLMVKSGRTYSNLMVALVVSNEKLHSRALKILELATTLSPQSCADALEECSGNVQVALVRLLTRNTPEACRQALAAQNGVRAAVEHLQE